MTLPTDYFDAMYAGSADPWGFRDRWYQLRKRAVTMAALPAARYTRAFEPGLVEGATLLSCHWWHEVKDYPATGDEVHAALGERGELHRLVRQVEIAGTGADVVLGTVDVSMVALGAENHVVRSGAIPVITSARSHGRLSGGFADHVAALG